MKQAIVRDYFIIAKFIGLLGLLAAMAMEFAEEDKRKKIIVSALEGILAISAVFLFPVTGTFFLLFFLLDLVAFVKGHALLYFSGYICLFFLHWISENSVLATVVVTLIIILYIQEKSILVQYRRLMEDSEKTEGKLKTDMEKKQQNYW